MLGLKVCGKVPRSALDDIHIDYYIDFVCFHKGHPVYGFLIVDNNLHADDLEKIQASFILNCDFELYIVNADWIISQTIKPDNIICDQILSNY